MSWFSNKESDFTEPFDHEKDIEGEVILPEEPLSSSGYTDSQAISGFKEVQQTIEDNESVAEYHSYIKKFMQKYKLPAIAFPIITQLDSLPTKQQELLLKALLIRNFPDYMP